MNATDSQQQQGWSLYSVTTAASGSDSFFRSQLRRLRLWSLGPVVAAPLFIIIFSIILTARHGKLLRIVMKTFLRDLSGIIGFIKTTRELRVHERAGDSVGCVFERTVARHPTKVCFQFEDQVWTFAEVKSMSDRVARYFYCQGYRRGDVVALFMENRPEYVCIWLGLSKIGVVTSLINTNLRQHSLLHSFQISNTTAVIYGTELAAAMEEALFEETSSSMTLPLFSMGSMKAGQNAEQQRTVANSCGSLGNSSQNLQECLLQLDEQVGSSMTQVAENEPNFHDNLFYIFTSGTTGLPKATITKHSRFIFISVAYQNMNRLRSDDVFYTCLPLYHATGVVGGVGRALVYGNTVILRKKFSASAFWQDCVLHKVTVAQHIGEICRYLLRQGYRPEERRHRVRAMIGTGLRAEIWPEFRVRFGIKQIHEIYGSTDGNCTMINIDGRVGAVGFVPVLLQRISPFGLIRVDPVTSEPLRNPKSGLAIRCEPGEAGELVGTILNNDVVREFPGYAGSNRGIENKNKVLHNVFRQGDSYFRTGDLFVQDDYGYMYFKDRLGDTFRWKGENVSTAEVEGVIGSITGLKDCVVYGVQVPGTEGRAGMAAIADPGKSLDLQQLAVAMKKNLPAYARPLFIRLLDEIETTGTHKLRKVDLQKEGFCRESVPDPLFFYKDGKYAELTADLHKSLMEGAVRL